MVERRRAGFRGAAEEGEEGHERVSDKVSVSKGLGGDDKGWACPMYEHTKEYRSEGGVSAQGGKPKHTKNVRVFEGGATRDTDSGKLDYEGFFSPLVLKRRAEYMHKHRQQSDGRLRASDNWQNGIPVDEYMKSMFRHFVDVWMEHRGYDSREGIEEALCALMFNAEGYLFEILEEGN